jgi:hypothetical protein
MPCDPSSLTNRVPSHTPSLNIPGFGKPFAPTISSSISNGKTNGPEALLDIYKLVEFILPTGVLKPPLHPNYGKDMLDGIMQVLDYFFPFLMAYKLILPILDMIVCIIEILCAIPNPFKLIRAIKRLFRHCIPAFLALFPGLALISAIISIINLIIILVEYIVDQVARLVQILITNIQTIEKAFTNADEGTVLAAIKKIAFILCSFQNLFIAFTILSSFYDVIKEILSKLHSIPPCSSSSTDDNGCCTTDVCPYFIKNNDGMTFSTGKLQYYNASVVDNIISGIAPGTLITSLRNESWQFFDPNQASNTYFYNITTPFDLPPDSDATFFPVDGTYTGTTPVSRAPYNVDLRLFYNPVSFTRIDGAGPRFIRAKGCIVTSVPSNELKTYNNGLIYTPSGVLNLSGGTLYEDDGKTPITINGVKATLNNFINKPTDSTTGSAVLRPTDGYEFTGVEYVFHINYEVLLSKGLITLGCLPDVALDRDFANIIYSSASTANLGIINGLFNGQGTFPNPAQAQQCLELAVSQLRGDISAEGLANFQALVNACLSKIKSDAMTALKTMIDIGIDTTKSTYTVLPSTQFTTQPITVTVSLNNNNGNLLTNNLKAETAADIAKNLTGFASLGHLSHFTYDGSKYFTAKITSDQPGAGNLELFYNNSAFGTINTPTDLSIASSVSNQSVPYTFIYTSSSVAGTSERYDETDTSRLEE